MIIDKDTMMLEIETAAEAAEVENYVNQVVWKGEVHPAPEFVEDWYIICGLNETQRLLVMSTVLPTRFAMSVAAYWKLVAKQGV